MAVRAIRAGGRCACRLVLALSGAAAAAADLPIQLVSFGDITERDVYLEVSINGVNTTQLLRFRDAQGRLSASAGALGSVGVDVSSLGAPRASEIALDDIAGLRYTYNAAMQTVNLVVPDALRRPFEVDTRGVPQIPRATSGRGLILNYEAYAQTDAFNKVSMYSEQRYFDPQGTLNNTGTAYLGGRADRYVRYDTYWTHSDQDTLRTLRIGDTITSSLNWSRSVRVAGIQWGRNFALRPDLVTFPVSSLSASSVVPTSVSLYVNGVQQYSGNVPAGPFVVNQIPGITGSGQATLVTRDALGRSVSTSVPLYIDTRMLATGLSSYSIEAGVERRQFSVRSFDYDKRPAVTASGRYGMSDALTLEGHAELSAGVYNAGAGALVRLGQAGVVNGALSGSAGQYNGAQVSLGYQYIEPAFSIELQAVRALGDYGDLGSREDVPVPRQTDRATFSLPLTQSQSVALSYVGVRLPQAPAARIGSASYTANLHSRVSMNISAYNDFAQTGSHGVYIGLSILLGDSTQVNASVGRQGEQGIYSVGAQRNVDYDGGWGWGVENGRSGGAQYNQGKLQFLGRYGQLTALGQDYSGRGQAAVQAVGALVLMDGALTPSRRINDGFALVSTDGTPDVAVLHENRKLGRTNSAGHLLVPDLNSYQTNRLSIDPDELPVDMKLETTKAVAVPQAGSGVLVKFALQRYAAASVILHLPDGGMLPVGARVAHVESGKQSVVGYDGIAFVEDLQAENHLRVSGGAVSCVVDFPYRHDPARPLPTLGPFVCQPLRGPDS
ncbi:fimbria/pilus outer membrane usher protein [Achromobacter xylosoxidans]|uniref:fimbria/pilus outer membrane usher protein n=1 Tax=Alcaligenes xylosoxydans xylosoxydans TaxID=85698 RepID=UPI0006C6099F|nr:fimbria/pilus outer membrane usher protein [Achromobacter xylosoxidans]CUJ44520.1 F1 capsule-anchoring protein precursor [Achromobacter xylosoxidans]